MGVVPPHAASQREVTDAWRAKVKAINRFMIAALYSQQDTLKLTAPIDNPHNVYVAIAR